MLNLLNKCFRSTRAAAAVEFALLVPVILLTTAVIVELGRGLAQAQAIEKGLRGGIMVAARSSSPMTTAEKTIVRRMVRTGTVATGGTPLVDGWTSDSPVAIAETTTVVNGEDIAVITITATVDYVELLPGVVAMFGLGDVSVQTVHAQVHIGN